MKIRIAKPNQKGQLVIPKEIRDTLGISTDTPLHIVLRGQGFYIYPIKEVMGQTANENNYIKILQATRGAWRGARSNQAKKNLELTASQKRKKNIW